MSESECTGRWQFLERWTPGVHTHWHLLLSGLVWTGAGFMLVSLAWGWLELPGSPQAIGLFAGGWGLAWAIYRFGFSRIARKNLQRIRRMEGQVCIFAFQEWKSYLIVVVMMTLGSTLRHSGFPRLLLAPMYTGIGGGLLLSSLAYYKQLFRSLTDHSHQSSR